MSSGPSRIGALLGSQVTRSVADFLPFMLFLVAALPFATVHPGARSVVGVLIELVAILVLLVHTRHSPPLLDLIVCGLAALAVLLCGLHAIPIDTAARTLLQPGLAGAVAGALTQSGQSVHPIAVFPRGALQAWVFAAQVLLLGMASLTVLRRSRDAQRLAVVLTSTGLTIALIAWLHRSFHARTIWWISDIPNPMLTPFFAPFASPNHAGTAMAALIPLALTLFHGSTRLQIFGAVSAVVLAAGTWSTHSRGGILLVFLGLSVFGLLGRSRTIRAVTVAAWVALGACLLVMGPENLASWWSNLVVPKEYIPNVFTGRPAIYRETLVLFKGAPLLGVGLGGFETAYSMIKEIPEFRTINHAHQEYLQVLAEGGIFIALLWFLALGLTLFAGIKRALRPHEDSEPILTGFLGSAAVLMGSAAVDFPLRSGALAVLAVLVLAAVLALSSRRQKPGSNLSKRLFYAFGLVMVLITLLGNATLIATTGASESVWADPDRSDSEGDRLRKKASTKSDSRPERDALLDRAAGWYRASIRQRPSRVLSLVDLARVAMDRDDHPAAIRALEAAVQVYPTHPRPRIELARYRLKLGESEQARLDYARLLTLDPPTTATGTEWTREALSSVEDIQDLVVLLPPRADRMRDAGKLLFDGGRPDLAHEVLQEAIRIEPPEVSTDSTVAYAIILVREKNPEEALRILEGLPENCGVLTARGRAFFVQEKFDESIRCYEKSFSVCGSQNRNLRRALAQAKLERPADRSKALEILQRLLAEDPEDEQTRRVLILHYRDMQSTSELMRHLERLVDSGQANPREIREYVDLKSADTAHPVYP